MTIVAFPKVELTHISRRGVSKFAILYHFNHNLAL